EAEYIDAALTFALSELHLAPHGRAIHDGTAGKPPPRPPWRPPDRARCGASRPPANSGSPAACPPAVSWEQYRNIWLKESSGNILQDRAPVQASAPPPALPFKRRRRFIHDSNTSP